MKKEDLIVLKNKIELLEKGVDPQTELKIMEDTILASAYNKRILREMNMVLSNLIQEINKKEGMKKDTLLIEKKDFFLAIDDMVDMEGMDSEVTISELTDTINNFLNDKHVKRLRPGEITSWLKHKGLLQDEKDERGKCHRTTTEKGSIAGISKQARVARDGKKYEVNIYNTKAQKYIMDNLYKIAIYNNN